MTTETDCPSHTEARERLAKLAELAGTPNEDVEYPVMLKPAWARTLLDTPTQGEDSSLSRELSPAIGSALDWAETVEMLANPALHHWAAPNKSATEEYSEYKSGYWTCLEDVAGLVRRTRPSSAEQIAGKVPGIQNNTSGSTQEGIGREEIKTRIVEILHDNMEIADVTPPSGCLAFEIVGYSDAADAILSLLPAPKPGEGALDYVCPACGADVGLQCYERHDVPANESGVTRLLDEPHAARVAKTKPQQPAPGAPEGWREQCDRLCESSYRAGAKAGYNLGLGEDGAGLQKLLAAHHYPRAALTSSSAKPGGEEPSLDNTPYQSAAYERGEVDGIDGAVMRVREALNGKVPSGMRHGGLQALCDELATVAQSYRRLREGLEPFAKCVGMLLFQDEPDDTVLLLRRAEGDDAASLFKLAPTVGDFRRAAAALKDNGHA